MFRSSRSLFNKNTKFLCLEGTFLDRVFLDECDLVPLMPAEAYAALVPAHFTEWEAQHEEEEFVKAARIYRPLSSMLASRFHRGEDIQLDETTGAIKSIPLPPEKKEVKKASKVYFVVEAHSHGDNYYFQINTHESRSPVPLRSVTVPLNHEGNAHVV